MCSQEGEELASSADLNLLNLSDFMRRLEWLAEVGFMTSPSEAEAAHRPDAGGEDSIGMELMSFECILLSCYSSAPSLPASGAVKHADDNPLVGVSIVASCNLLFVHIFGLVVGPVYKLRVHLSRREPTAENRNDFECLVFLVESGVSGGGMSTVQMNLPRQTRGDYLASLTVADTFDDGLVAVYRMHVTFAGDDSLDYHTTAKPVCQPEPMVIKMTEEGLLERKELYAANPLSPHDRCRSSLVCQLAMESDQVMAQGIKAGCEGPRPAHSGVDTLIVYAFAVTEGGSGVWEDNLDFFLAQGLVADGRYRFVLVCNGEVDEAWRGKLDRIQAWLPNFQWFERKDEGRDVGAWRAVLNGEVGLEVDVERVKRFILMNSSIRGPFVPEYYREAWPEAVLGLLHSRSCPDCQLAGLLVDCNCELTQGESCSQSKVWLESPRAALDESMLAFGNDLLPLVASLLSQVLLQQHFISAFFALRCRRLAAFFLSRLPALI